MGIENPMVIDSLWRDFEKEPEIICECKGCGEEIYEGEDILEVDGPDGEKVYLHQDNSCTYEYVESFSVRKTAGE